MTQYKIRKKWKKILAGILTAGVLFSTGISDVPALSYNGDTSQFAGYAAGSTQNGVNVVSNYNQINCRTGNIEYAIDPNKITGSNIISFNDTDGNFVFAKVPNGSSSGWCYALAYKGSTSNTNYGPEITSRDPGSDSGLVGLTKSNDGYFTATYSGIGQWVKDHRTSYTGADSFSGSSANATGTSGWSYLIWNKETFSEMSWVDPGDTITMTFDDAVKKSDGSRSDLTMTISGIHVKLSGWCSDVAYASDGSAGKRGRTSRQAWYYLASGTGAYGQYYVNDTSPVSGDEYTNLAAGTPLYLMLGSSNNNSSSAGIEDIALQFATPAGVCINYKVTYSVEDAPADSNLVYGFSDLDQGGVYLTGSSMNNTCRLNTGTQDNGAYYNTIGYGQEGIVTDTSVNDVWILSENAEYNWKNLHMMQNSVTCEATDLTGKGKTYIQTSAYSESSNRLGTSSSCYALLPTEYTDANTYSDGDSGIGTDAAGSALLSSAIVAGSAAGTSFLWSGLECGTAIESLDDTWPFTTQVKVRYEYRDSLTGAYNWSDYVTVPIDDTTDTSTEYAADEKGAYDSDTTYTGSHALTLSNLKSLFDTTLSDEDYDHLELSNDTENGSSYTSYEGETTYGILSSSEAGGTTVSVTDTGTGISFTRTDTQYDQVYAIDIPVKRESTPAIKVTYDFDYNLPGNLRDQEEELRTEGKLTGSQAAFTYEKNANADQISYDIALSDYTFVGWNADPESTSLTKSGWYYQDNEAIHTHAAGSSTTAGVELTVGGSSVRCPGCGSSSGTAVYCDCGEMYSWTCDGCGTELSPLITGSVDGKIDSEYAVMTQDRTFYAIWERTSDPTVTVNVRYEDKDGKFPETYTTVVSSASVACGSDYSYTYNVTGSAAVYAGRIEASRGTGGLSANADTNIILTDDDSTYVQIEIVSDQDDEVINVDIYRKSYTYTFRDNLPDGTDAADIVRGDGYQEEFTKLAENTADTQADLAYPGYTFKGWFSNPDGTGDQYDNDNPDIMLSDKTFYAYWEKEQVYVPTGIHVSPGQAWPAVGFPVAGVIAYGLYVKKHRKSGSSCTGLHRDIHR